MTDVRLERGRRREHRVEVDVPGRAKSLKHVEQILGREIAGGAGRVRTAAEPARRRVERADPEVDRRLSATRDLAEKLAISGTPTFVFDNQMVRGYLPLDQMKSLVGQVRASD